MRRTVRRRCCTGSMQAALVALMLPWCAHAAELSIAVEHIHSGQGTVMIGLYDNAEAFDSAADSYRALLVDLNAMPQWRCKPAPPTETP